MRTFFFFNLHWGHIFRIASSRPFITCIIFQIENMCYSTRASAVPVVPDSEGSLLFLELLWVLSAVSSYPYLYTPCLKYAFEAHFNA